MATKREGPGAESSNLDGEVPPANMSNSPPETVPSQPKTESATENALVVDGRNSKTVMCERCSSVVLLPKAAKVVRKEIFLPHMKKKSEKQAPGDGETLLDYWVVGDMFEFENIGFSNTVDNIKYLICADCEVGPIGWHDITDKKAFFIALDRVKHK